MNKVLSLILCSRNDNYMGNPVGRLEIAINYVAKNLRAIGREAQVEIIVTDWGSKIPLREVLHLNETAAQITRFLEVPAQVVKESQKDSPFAEVLALNAAARCANGQYIGRIDQDTLVGEYFLTKMFEWHDSDGKSGVQMKDTFLFSKRRQIPFRVAMGVTAQKNIELFLRLSKSNLLVEEWPPYFFNSPVGIMILSKELWVACGGYDERLLYWGWMEVDLAYRLKEKYRLLDIGDMVKYDFYHLEHYDPRLPRVTPRKMNPRLSENLEFHPNTQDWGLFTYKIDLSPYVINSKSSQKEGPYFVDDIKQHLIVYFYVCYVWLAHLPWFLPESRLVKSYQHACGLSRRGLGALGRPRRYPRYFKQIVNRLLGISS